MDLGHSVSTVVTGLYEAITQQTLRGGSLTVDLLPEGTTKDLLKQVL